MRITSTQIDVKEPFDVLDLELEQMCGIMIWELLSIHPVRSRSIVHPNENSDHLIKHLLPGVVATERERNRCHYSQI